MKNEFLKKYRYHFLIAMIALINFIFILCFSWQRSLWYDDIYQIYFSWNRPFIDTMKIVLEVDLNPPLWAILSFLWLKIAPYGTMWLKLPSMILTSMAVFTVGLTAKELFGKRTGLLATLFFTLSSVITLECAYSFRTYGLYIFASVFLLYSYVKKAKAPNLKNRILFLFGVFIAAFTHYFGALLCVFLGISDLLLVFRKKQSVNFFIEYVAVAGVELFWFIPQLTTIGSALSSFWPSRPTFKSFFNAFKYMLYDSRVVTILFIILALLFIYAMIRSIKKSGLSALFDEKRYFQLLFLIVPFFYVLLIFIYSNIKPESSVWVDRYFLSLSPMVVIFLASVIVDVYDAIITKFDKHKKLLSVFSLLLVIAVLLPNYAYDVVKKTNTEYEPFEQVSELIMSQPEVRNGEKVLIINTTNCGGGWDYYLSKNNTVDMSNTKTMDLVSYSSSELRKYDTIFLYAVHFDGSFSLDRIREEITQTHAEEIVDSERNVFKYVRIK